MTSKWIKRGLVCALVILAFCTFVFGRNVSEYVNQQRQQTQDKTTSQYGELFSN